MRHIITAGALACLLALTAACGNDSAAEGAAEETPTATETTASASETPTATPSESPTGEGSESPTTQPQPEPRGVVIEMTLAGGKVSPAGDRVEAEAGEPITFVIDADAPGEMHVHSTPESYIEFGIGESEHEIVVDQPGVIEVELHEPPVVVVQLEVR